ncbi:UDP binding domain-containing protein [Spirillospora sp. NPDC052269]
MCLVCQWPMGRRWFGEALHAALWPEPQIAASAVLRRSLRARISSAIPHAAAMASLGHEVIGVDIDQAKVDRLNAGECPIYEIGLPELLVRHTESGRLRFTTEIREAAEFAEVHFIGVGTPIDVDGRSYDTSQVYGAVRQLAPHLERPCTIIGKSTVTVGTTSQVTALAQRLAPAGAGVEVVWNPEFLREGHAVQDTLRPDRIIAGLTTAEGEKALRAAERVNERRIDVALRLIHRALGDRLLKGAQVTVWGAAFKPGTSDVRESPALALAQALQQAGATVTVHDPQAQATATMRHPELECTSDLPGSLDGADLVVLATEWPEYLQADPQALVALPANPLLVDCRTALDPEPWRSSGWTVHQLGRPENATGALGAG